MGLTRNVETFEPLPLRLRPIFLNRVRSLTPTGDRFGFLSGAERVNLGARETLLFMYHTGCHPEVLVHPRSSLLRVAEGEHGPEIRFDRPKKRTDDPTAKIALTIAPDLVDWVGDWILSLRERDPHVVREVRYTVKGRDGNGRVQRTRSQDFCSEPVSYLVTTMFSELQMPGYSARTIRHTFANWVWLTTHKVGEVSKAMGVNQADALRYCTDAAEDYEYGKQLLTRTV